MPARAALIAGLALATAIGVAVVETAPADIPIPAPATRVALDYGAFTGYVDDGVNVWKGIPFAQAPIGPLRFKAPQNITANVGEVDATSFGPACPQFDKLGLLVGKEDCLQLNIWAPQASSGLKNLPVITKANVVGYIIVMVWIYGGGFVRGSTDTIIYDGATNVRSAMGTNASVVIVSISYRVGALGWLASDSLIAEGSTNVGLLDQRAAMAWVKKYIVHFNGDPDKVTIWGESAGAISVASHILGSPAPLFSKGILESGSPFYLTTKAEELNPVFEAIARATGCGGQADKLACLRGVPIADLMKADGETQALLHVNYAPYVDGAFLKDRPIKLIHTPGYELHQVPVLLGTNTDEGTIFTPVRNESALAIWLSNEFPNANLSLISTLYPTDGTDATAFNVSASIFQDAIFQCGVRLLADTLSLSGDKVYRYHFNHVPAVNLIGAPPMAGVYHAAELAFVFDKSSLLAPDEKPLAKAMSGAWVNFAVFGDPNGGTDVGGVVWPAYVGDKTLVGGGGGKMIRFDSGSPGGIVTEVDNLRSAQCAYWNSYLMTGDFPPRVEPPLNGSTTTSVTSTPPATAYSTSTKSGVAAPDAFPLQLLHALPDELFSIVCSSLLPGAVRDLARLRLTCAVLADRVLPTLYNCPILPTHPTSPLEAPLIRHGHHVRHLAFQEGAPPLRVLDVAPHLPNLLSLDLSNVPPFLITDGEVMALLRCCPRLASINLSDCVDVTDASLRALAVHPNLRRLRTLVLDRCCEVTDSGLIPVLRGAAGSLRKLGLNLTPFVTRASLWEVAAHCEVLECLGLAENDCVTGETLGWLAASLPRLEELDISGCERLTEADLVAAARKREECETCCVMGIGDGSAPPARLGPRPSLVSLKMNDAPFATEASVSALLPARPLPHSTSRLHTLELSHAHSVTPALLTHLTSHHSTLTLLNLNHIAISTPPPLPSNACPLALFIAAQPQLHTLHLSGGASSHVTDDLLASISTHLPLLTTIDLSDCELVSDAGVSALASACPLLMDVNLKACRLLTDAAVSSLASQPTPRLRFLNVGLCTLIADGAASALAAVCAQTPTAHEEGIHTLKFSGCVNITDASLTHLLPATTLRLLCLSGCRNITATALSALLPKLSHLESINLYACSGVDDDAVVLLARSCPRLQSVVLSRCGVGDRGVVAIAEHCRRVHTCYMSFLSSGVGALTSVGVGAMLRGCPELKLLDVTRCVALADEAFEGLERGMMLQVFMAKCCGGVTFGGLGRLVEACPRLQSLDVVGSLHRPKMRTAFLLTAVATVNVASAANSGIPNFQIDDKVKAAVADDFLEFQQSDFFVPIAPVIPAGTTTARRRDGLAKRGGGGGGGEGPPPGPPASCPRVCVNGNQCRVGCKTWRFTPTTFQGSNDTARIHEYRPQNAVFVADGMPCNNPDGCNVTVTNMQSATVTWSMSTNVDAKFDGSGMTVTPEYGQAQTTTNAKAAQLAIGPYGTNYIGFVPNMTVTYGWINHWEIINTDGTGMLYYDWIQDSLVAPNLAADGSGLGDFVVCEGGIKDGPCVCIGGCENVNAPRIMEMDKAGGGGTTTAAILATTTAPVKTTSKVTSAAAVTSSFTATSSTMPPASSAASTAYPAMPATTAASSVSTGTSTVSTSSAVVPAASTGSTATYPANSATSAALPATTFALTTTTTAATASNGSASSATSSEIAAPSTIDAGGKGVYTPPTAPEATASTTAPADRFKPASSASSAAADKSTTEASISTPTATGYQPESTSSSAAADKSTTAVSGITGYKPASPTSTAAVDMSTTEVRTPSATGYNSASTSSSAAADKRTDAPTYTPSMPATSISSNAAADKTPIAPANTSTVQPKYSPASSPASSVTADRTPAVPENTPAVQPAYNPANSLASTAAADNAAVAPAYTPAATIPYAPTDTPASTAAADRSPVAPKYTQAAKPCRKTGPMGMLDYRLDPGPLERPPGLQHHMLQYFRKMAGTGQKSPAPVTLEQSMFSTVVSILSLMIVYQVNERSLDNLRDADYLLASFGASAVLVYHAIDSPMAQPLNVVVGQGLSAIIGVVVAKIVPQSMLWLGGPLAVALAVLVMTLTNTTHPPGGATALVAVIGSDHLRSLGFYYVLQPVLTGAVAMLVCAVVFNNLHPKRQYPLYWINQFWRWRCDVGACTEDVLFRDAEQRV
ncbi:hypothetical protein HK101_011814 [Irineochytrium annulatum]|nr:hypothetical protein HK101_011814 [Irineochytrium annulatum]